MNIKYPSLYLLAILILLLPVLVNADFADEIKLTADDGANGDSFGQTVSISGNTAIVGARFNDSNGSAYIFVRDPTNGTWTQQQKLRAIDGASQDSFGVSVSISGDTAIIGAEMDDDAGNSSGSAYVFTRNPSTGVWTQQQKLLASDDAAYDYFGRSVAISGDRAIVGSPWPTGITFSTGYAYIFVRNPATGVWTEQQKLQPSDGAVNDYFGIRVAIDGGTALIGSDGGSYTYEYNSGTGNWDESKLVRTNTSESVGRNVSIRGDIAITGAPYLTSYGSAYIFERDPTTGEWAELQMLARSGVTSFDNFGLSVAIDSDLAIVGAHNHDDPVLDAGAAYAFVRDPVTGAWTQQKLLASDGSAFGGFGYSVSIDSDMAIIGADGAAGVVANTGAAYVYTYTAPPASDITVTDSVAPTTDLAVAFGDVVELASADQTVTITNDGNAELVLGAIAQANPLATPFTILSDTCSAQTLAPTANCNFTVRFSPQSTGAFNDSFDIPSNDPDENSVTVNVEGTGIVLAKADITVTDSISPVDDLSIPFGSITLASVSDQTITISNDGNANLSIGDIAALNFLTAPFSIQNNNCSTQTLAPTASCTLTVRFAPASAGTFNDSFDIPSDDADETSVTVNVSGTGLLTLTPDITVTDAVAPIDDLQIPFGDVADGVAVSKSMKIINDGSADLILGKIALSDKLALPFSIHSDSCSSQTLKPAASCTLMIGFAPTSIGIFNDSFDIPSNDADEASVTINLSGTGVIIDLDNDGYSPPEDCNDLNANINPFKNEMCNGFDDNCDGAIDEGFSASETLDLDGDSIPACIDNCPATANQNQLDSDGDGMGDACTASAVLKSPYAREIPTIDGIYSYGEWPYSSENLHNIGNQLDLQNGFVRVSNDGARLYILIDLLNDPVDNSEAPRDYFTLTFDVNNDGLITPATDLDYTLSPNVANIRYRYYKGADDWSDLQYETFSSMARGFDCNIDDGSKTFTATFQPDTCSKHRIWEIAIDLEEINASSGSTVTMGLQVASSEPGFIENFPADFTSNFSKLVEIQLTTAPPITEDYQTGHIRFELDAIEVTQAIQNQQSTLPLVQDKDTVARVYLHSHDSDTPIPTKSLVSLYAMQNGIDLPGSPKTQIHLAPKVINRDSLNDTANFMLPKSWTKGDVIFHAIARGIELNDAGDVSQVVPLTFTAKEIPTYWTIRINTGSEAIPDQVEPDVLLRQEEALKAIYPLADVNFIQKSWQAVGVIPPINSVDDLMDLTADLQDYYHQVLMGWSFGAYLTGVEPFRLPDQIYGMADASGAISDPIWANSGKGIVAGGGIGSSRALTMAHEINHNLGPGNCQNRVDDGLLDDMWGRHVAHWPSSDLDESTNPSGYCITGEETGVVYGGTAGGPDPDWQELFDTDEIGEFGFDTRLPWVAHGSTLVVGDPEHGRRTVIPPDFSDVMSYDRSAWLPNKWISAYRWRRLFNYFENADTAPQAKTVVNRTNFSLKSIDINQIADMYYISGQLHDDGTGTLDPVTIAPGVENLPSGYGNYRLQFVDAMGTTIQDYAFDVSFVSVEGEPVTMVPFYFRIPIITDTDVAAVHLQHTQVSLDSLVVSENPPQVTILSPNGGEHWSGSGTVSWLGSDADNDQLTYSLLYSPNNGNLWVPIARKLLTTSYTVDTSIMMGGDNALFRVIATDGFHTAMDDSDLSFILDQNPPDVVIHAPLAGDISPDNRNISFCGNATDPEDETLPEDAFVWVMGSDEVIGLGRCIEATLPAGLQEVTLQVTDSHGSSNKSTVQIEIFASNIWYLDQDGDGFGQMEECNDNDQSINPKAVELCDGIDNNCDSQIDGGLDDDADGIGEVCDDDDDNDGVLDSIDNCRLTSNFDQTDTDSDGIGDACDFDDDSDGILDNADNCQFISNVEQANDDNDTLGDLCDDDFGRVDSISPGKSGGGPIGLFELLFGLLGLAVVFRYRAHLRK